MSTYTYKLKGARWLRMWTAADRSSVYAAQSEAQKIADTLCDVPWTRAKSDGPAMFPLTAAKSLDENPANRDLFDAALFCAEHSDGAHRAYANAAMYLFKLPSTSGVNLKSVTVHVESDAYNALGARIAVHLLSSAELPTDCATVRTGAAHAEGVAARRTVERDGRNYWYSNSADVTITGGTSESPAAIGDLKQYLAVFVGMENYATSRNEWLEGASYIRNLIEIETDGQISNWTNESMYDCVEADPTVLLDGGNSPTWLEPLPTVNAGASAGYVPVGAEVEATFFTPAVSHAEPESAVWRIEDSVSRFGVSLQINVHLLDAENNTASFDASMTVTGPKPISRTQAVNMAYTEDPRSMYGEISGFYASDETITETITLGTVTYNGQEYLRGISTSSFWRVVRDMPQGSDTDSINTYEHKLVLFMKMPAVSSAGDARPDLRMVSSDLVKYIECTGLSVASPTLTGGNGANVKAVYDKGSYSTTKQLVELLTTYYMLRMVGGVPSFMDACDSPDETARRGEQSTVSGIESPWTVTAGGVSFGVAVDGRQVTLTQGTSHSWQFTLPPDDEIAGEPYFDASANLRVENASIENYGLAAALGDFSHAVATFEAGTQPSNAEVLGRLARMSRKEAGAMLYLHPENGALANELDMLRPVPRFFRVDEPEESEGAEESEEDLPVQTNCQPGLSVWYKRATTSSGGTTVTGSSSAAIGIVQRERPTSEAVVADPAFLQLTVLVLRAQSAFSTRLVLANKVGASNADAVTNDFKLRFVAWCSPADQWDGSNAFAMAAMASMPSIYRSDGDGNVAWNVDCTGNLLRFGTRAMTAERIGVSQVVSGEIAAGASIGIPLAAPVAAGDVVLIAPEVLGFADGVGGLSKYFGRQADPAAATDAGNGGARFAHNLGWFPRVTGE